MQIVIDIPEEEYKRMKAYAGPMAWAEYLIVKGTPLDKIRAKIMQLDYDLESVDYDYNDTAQTEMVHMICREEVLQIIDKYNAESEGKG